MNVFNSLFSNICPFFFQAINSNCGTRSDVVPCSSDEIDDEKNFPCLQSRNPLSVDFLCDSDASICFPIVKSDNAAVSKASSPICVSRGDVVHCSSDEIDGGNFPCVQSQNQLSVDVLCNSIINKRFMFMTNDLMKTLFFFFLLSLFLYL